MFRNEDDWKRKDLVEWKERNGLSDSNVLDILNRHPLTSLAGVQDVKDILSGRKPVWEEYEAEARRFDESRFVNDDVDMAGTLAELHVKCSSVPQGVVTGVSSAAMRGWTTANTHMYFVATPSEHANKEYADNIVTVASDNILEHVELRQDHDGNWYRIADPVRTVVDAVRDDANQDMFSVEEVFREAISEGVKIEDLQAFAEKQGPIAVERLKHYISLIS